MMASVQANYFLTLRHRRGLKMIFGMRGIGKGMQLRDFREALLLEGVSSSRILYLDAESPLVRRCATCEQFMILVHQSLPSDGVSFLLIREAGSLPDAETTLGMLAASSRYDVYVTLSSRQLLASGLGKCLSEGLSLRVLPPPEAMPMPTERALALWNTIFLRDVLSPQRILDVGLISRAAGYLSDNLGDPISLRQVAAAVSPTGRLISPHTTAAYLDALADAFLVEKAVRFDLAEDAPQSTRYCYFFTSLELRNAQFGAAPNREIERARLNAAWIRLRRAYDNVFIASGSKLVNFVTRAKGVTTFWRVAESGLQTIARNQFIAG